MMKRIFTFDFLVPTLLIIVGLFFIRVLVRHYWLLFFIWILLPFAMLWIQRNHKKLSLTHDYVASIRNILFGAAVVLSIINVGSYGNIRVDIGKRYIDGYRIERHYDSETNYEETCTGDAVINLIGTPPTQCILENLSGITWYNHIILYLMQMIGIVLAIAVPYSTSLARKERLINNENSGEFENINLNHIQISQQPSLNSIQEKKVLLNIFTEWCISAAKQGDVGAQWYLDSYNQIKDLFHVKELYRRAIKENDVAAQNELGIMYSDEFGNTVSQDYKQSAYWYSRAAAEGDADSQYMLGECYEKGVGLGLDYKQAAYWYSKAAEKGHASAQLQFGTCYEKGLGVAQDNKQAAYWYRKSAEQDDVTAIHNIATCYEKGIGVERDQEQEAYWRNKFVDWYKRNSQ